MGLDVQIIVNNHQEVFDIEYIKEYDQNRKLHSLSRTFCNLMCRRDMVNHDSELDQISEFTGVEVQPLFDMNFNTLEDLENNKALFKDNLEIILSTIQRLITELEKTPDLVSLLIETDFDSLNNSYYFSRFNEDLGDGYIGNNFGQDLRNFERFLRYTKAKGTKTIGFHYE